MNHTPVHAKALGAVAPAAEGVDSINQEEEEVMTMIAENGPSVTRSSGSLAPSQLSYGILLKSKAQESFGQAARAAEGRGIVVKDGKGSCHTFTNSVGRPDPAREIGQVHWHQDTQTMNVYAYTDATRDDLTCLLMAACEAFDRRNYTGLAWKPYRARPGVWTFVARSLSSYGDDLAMVARMPETTAGFGPAPASTDDVDDLLADLDLWAVAIATGTLRTTR